MEDTSPHPDERVELRVMMEAGQVYVYDASIDLAAREYEAYLDSLDDATASGRWVGTCDGLINVLSPCQWNFDTPFIIERWTGPPAVLDADWEHVVELDFDAPSGRLIFEASGGVGEVETSVSPGCYRARIAGKGLGYDSPGTDSYMMQLWSRDADADPILVRKWAGWDREPT